MSDFEVFDGNDVLLAVGVATEDGAVVEITEPDYDYDDELQRAVEFPPVVITRDAAGEVARWHTFNDTPITWADYPDGPAKLRFRCDDVVAVKDTDEPV